MIRQSLLIITIHPRSSQQRHGQRKRLRQGGGGGRRRGRTARYGMEGNRVIYYSSGPMCSLRARPDNRGSGCFEGGHLSCGPCATAKNIRGLSETNKAPHAARLLAISGTSNAKKKARVQPQLVNSISTYKRMTRRCQLPFLWRGIGKKSLVG